ncbi:MAG: metallophosphoesterase [Candidatus Thorarchaeota archaeon]
MTSTSRRSVLKKIITSGYQISPDAIDYIMGLQSPLQIVDSIITKCEADGVHSFISQELVMNFIGKNSDLENEHSVIEEPEIEDIRRMDAKSGEDSDDTPMIGSIMIVKNPTYKEVGSTGTVEDFLALFNDRFKRIKRIYMERIDTQTAVSIESAKGRRYDAHMQLALAAEGGRSQRPSSQKVIGIVKSKRVSKARNVIVEIEDKDDTMLCIIPSGRKGLAGAKLAEKGNSLLLDEITCISGRVDQDGRMIADDVIFPDIPTVRNFGRASRDVYAAFISDLHCGSEEFLEDELDQFIDWISGKDVDTDDKAWVKRLEYLFIAGDLVDGIGVYPNQKNNLMIPDLHDQYSYIASKLRNLPSRITTVIIPGNHDACRQALPKPPISEDFGEALHKLGDRVLMMGDPCHLRIEGVDIVLTHGDSMDDLVVNSPGASYRTPAVGMRELLLKRHLAPIYGSKTELAPLHRDWMVIESPPDIVHFGHAHHNCCDNYRGVQIINSGTFQGQTDFMRKQGIVPTPGLVTFVNLRSGAPSVKAFFDFSKLDTSGQR